MHHAPKAYGKPLSPKCDRGSFLDWTVVQIDMKIVQRRMIPCLVACGDSRIESGTPKTALSPNAPVLVPCRLRTRNLELVGL